MSGEATDERRDPDGAAARSAGEGRGRTAPPTAATDGGTARPWSNAHWRRIKYHLGGIPASFVGVALGIAVENPPDSGASFGTAPLTYAMTAAFLLVFFSAPVLVPYYVGKDRAELEPHFEDVAQRPWSLVAVLTVLTAGGYVFWYCYVRWRRLPDRRVTGTVAPADGDRDASPAEVGGGSGSGSGGGDGNGGDRLRSGLGSIGDGLGAAGAWIGLGRDDGEGATLAANAAGEVSPRRLTRTRRFLDFWLFDDPPVAYLGPGEQPEFLLRHPNKGLHVREPNGQGRRLDGRLSAGETYLLVTDRRLLYLSGAAFGADTVRSFEYGDLASVEADTGLLTGTSLTVEDRDGVTYTFPAAVFAGYGFTRQAPQVRAAGSYVERRIREERPAEPATAREPAADATGEPAGTGASTDREGSAASTGGNAAGASTGQAGGTGAGIDPDRVSPAGRDAATAGAASSGPETDAGAAASTANGDDAPVADGTRASRAGPPDRIPRAPDVPVDYESLTDEGPVGGGGNADVKRAVVPTGDGGVDVAVKTPRLSGTLHTDAIERMLDEAETWDRLDDHDHVVGVVDYGADPIPWIAMEYMDAGHLGDRADVPLDQALWTAVGITSGVRHAHRRGVAHLDLKPENVLFRGAEGAWDVPKVADWGLSKHLLDHSKSVEGLSPTYAAPEQFDEERGPADDITDVYQLGAVCYELFTGRPPFEGSSAEVMRKVLHEDPTPPSEVADLPPALDDVLLRALAKSRDERYDSLVYVRDELRALYSEHR